MPIMPLAPGAYKATNTSRMLVEARLQLDDLQRQLVTGKKSETFGGLGVQRITSLDMRARQSEVEGYRSTITFMQIRTKQLDLGLNQLGKMGDDVRNNLILPSYNPDGSGQTAMQRYTRTRFDEAVDVLNTDINGVRLYGGRKTDVKPVLDPNVILNGDAAGRAGVTQMIAERKAADYGAVATAGRVVRGGAGATATLTEDGAHPFGFKLSAASSSTANITATLTAGPPANINFTVAALPAAGDRVSFELTLPDNSRQTVTLTARTGPTVPVGDAGGFDIGATPAITGANLRAAIADAMTRESVTSLPAASAIAAADAFFAGSLGSPPLRVVGPPATATTLAAGTPANTVIWYQGDDTSPNARQTVLAKIDTGVTVGVGVQANETGIARLMARLAVFSIEQFNVGNANDQGRFQAMTDRLRQGLGPQNGMQSVQTIQTDIAMASVTMSMAGDRHKVKLGFVQDVIAGIEDANKEETAATLLALQNKLQATYQTTSIISRLNLTDYLR